MVSADDGDPVTIIDKNSSVWRAAMPGDTSPWTAAGTLMPPDLVSVH
jgi:hypothetical protein